MRIVLNMLIWMIMIFLSTASCEAGGIYRVIATVETDGEIVIHRGIANGEMENDLSRAEWKKLSRIAWFPKIAAPLAEGDSFKTQAVFSDEGLPFVNAVVSVNVREAISFSKGDAFLCTFSLRGAGSNNPESPSSPEIESISVEAEGMFLADAMTGRARAGRARFTRKFVHALWSKNARAGDSAEAAWVEIP